MQETRSRLNSSGNQPHGAAATRDGREPAWLRSTSQALRELLSLPPNWNSYGARAIDPECVDSAIDVLVRTTQPGTPAPHVIPTARGGVQLEWHLRDIDLEVEVTSPGRFEVACEDQRTGTGWEADLSSDLTPLAESLAELSRRG